LEFVKVKFLLEATDDIVLPKYKGSTFRGAFGWQFKRITCVLKSRNNCDGCLVQSSCFYYNIFETVVSDIPRLKSGEKIPHPYILVPPLEEKNHYETGEQFSFELLILGKYVEALPYFIFTFEELGKKGFKRNNGTFKIKNLYQNDHSIYNDNKLNFKPQKLDIIELKSKYSPAIEIKLITPLRLLRKGKPVNNPDFYEFFMAALRRAELLLYYYSNTKIDEIMDVKKLIEQARKVKLYKPEFYWYNWERYSNRQKKKISLSGIKGSFFLKDLPEDIFAILKFGEIFHLGKNTAFGLGKYEIL